MSREHFHACSVCHRPIACRAPRVEDTNACTVMFEFHPNEEPFICQDCPEPVETDDEETP